ncbi:MAG: orotidine-5'-phosphate decarboxylase [Flavobacteriales bacterium]|nr:orotidine-5'-phosphate decarboxylase [Flavobacteriales bacterium]
MNKNQLTEAILKKKSYLCVGLDTELGKIPPHLLNEPDPLFSFNKLIVEATSDYAVAYKINTAFYEQYGKKGWESLERTLEIIPDDCFTIADAKRGDIGNTGDMYAKAFFEHYSFDSVTVSPYMGKDSIQPFLNYSDKFTIVLGLTSNSGSADFQMLQTPEGKLYEQVLSKVASWGTPEQLMFVVGATRSDLIKQIRKRLPDYFFLVPGIGAQGGDLKEVSLEGMNSECGLLINSSRGIIYASKDVNFDEVAAANAKELQVQMQQFLQLKNIL